MDRAVSDVLGYVLIFSLITGAVALVYATGYTSLYDVRDAERFNNAERAFDVLDSNMEDVVFERVPSRATEVKLSDASIGFGDPVVINVSVDGGGSIESSVEPLEFSIGDDRALAYSNGAIIRGSGENSVMHDEPNFLFGSRTVVPILDVRSRTAGVSGSGRVLVRAETSKQDVYEFDTTSKTVTINVTTTRTGAWTRYLEEATGEDCTTIGQTVSCDYDGSDTLYVQVTKIDVFII